MARYYKAPRPGAANGPCLDATCDHSGCAEKRRQLAVPCAYCKKKVKSGDPMYIDLGNFLHVACVWAAKSVELEG
jgi:hypothetical protein